MEIVWQRIVMELRKENFLVPLYLDQEEYIHKSLYPTEILIHIISYLSTGVYITLYHNISNILMQ